MQELKQAYKRALDAKALSQEKYKTELEGIDKEVEITKEQSAARIEKMVKDINPQDLETGFLVIKRKVDHTFNTTSQSAETIAELILSAFKDE